MSAFTGDAVARMTSFESFDTVAGAGGSFVEAAPVLASAADTIITAG